ncbi:hypothetical protein B481_3088 [Planococcus halocryophilus Or1]|uniref:S26 family signal peptidase n=1 Tax=Planococcus halocryophilus TaxID=1215089 RepID=UPI0002B889C7|nr:S26 family signal peptidase [Planococcus halocryophilus]EMF45537.1 hypothetical protein B481_3088 [Planococcus halocryophilus Or1]
MLKFYIVLIILISILVGCAPESIKDEDSYQIPPLLTDELGEDMKEVEVFTDVMQRDGQFPEKVVVDTNYYSSNEVSRGDLVQVNIPADQAAEYSQGNPGSHVVRVVALPGETVKAEEGQLYVDGAELETFYGSAYRWAGGSSAEQTTDFSMPEFTVPESSFLLSGDNWWRSPVNIAISPIPREFIVGKVIGYIE